MSAVFDDGAITLYGRPFQGRWSNNGQVDIGLLQPPPLQVGLGCSPFARHYLGNLN